MLELLSLQLLLLLLFQLLELLLQMLLQELLLLLLLLSWACRPRLVGQCCGAGMGRLAALEVGLGTKVLDQQLQLL